MALQIGVIGGGVVSEETAGIAYQVGKRIAEAGAVLVCGGLSGVMEQACKGAREAGGTTIGIVPSAYRGTANAFVDFEIVTGAGQARNVIIAQTADVLIAVSGEYGTLSEIALGLKLGKPVITLQSWEIEGTLAVSSPDEAVALALEKAKQP